MRIAPYQAYTMYSNKTQKNSSNYTHRYNQTNPFFKSQVLSKDEVSFGHYLDDELESAQREYSSVNSEISSTERKISSERSYHYSKCSDLDDDITKQRKANNGLNGQINTLQTSVNEKNKQIELIQKEGTRLEGSVKVNTQTIDKLKKEQEQSLNTVRIEKEKTDKIYKEKMNAAMQATQQAHKQEVERALNGPRVSLINKVINPIVAASEGENVSVPKVIFFESESNDVAKGVFEWLVKTTNFSYSAIDAKDYENKQGLSKMLNFITEKSNENYQVNQRRTFTFVDNFDDFLSTDNKERQQISNQINDFLKKSNNSYNTIILPTSDSSSLGSIIQNKTEAPIRITLDKHFLADKRLGYATFLKEAAEMDLPEGALKMPFSQIDLSKKNIEVKDANVTNKIHEPNIPVERKITAPPVVNAEEVVVVSQPKTKTITNPVISQVQANPQAQAQVQTQAKVQTQIQNNASAQQAPITKPAVHPTTSNTTKVTVINNSTNVSGWKSIAGYSDIKQNLNSIFIHRLELDQKGTKAQIPSGIILYGPDGLGKTLFARTLAQESKCNLVEINAEKSNSQILKNAENAAIEAEKSYKTINGTKRTIILLDNLDLTADRFSQFKDLISNCSEKYKCTFLITTNNNYAANINKPGINKFFIEAPNKSNLENIFRLYLKDFSKNEKIDYAKLANDIINPKATHGFYSISRIKTAIENYSKAIMHNQSGFSQESLVSIFRTMGPDISMAQLEKYGKNALSRIIK